MILYALYVDAIFFPCHPYIWSTTVLHDSHSHGQSKAPTTVKKTKTCKLYRIAPNFRGAKFSRIGLLKHFAEINFADQRFLMPVPVLQNISRSLIFAVQEESAKTAKIMRLKNLALYGKL